MHLRPGLESDGYLSASETSTGMREQVSEVGNAKGRTLAGSVCVCVCVCMCMCVCVCMCVCPVCIKLLQSCLCVYVCGVCMCEAASVVSDFL